VKMRLTMRLSAIALTAAAATAVTAAACESGSYYIYLGRIYEPQRDCVSDVEALDIEQGRDPGSGCAPQCLVLGDPDGGVVIYATTMCGPVPYGVDTSGSDPRCSAALKAVQRSDICLDGGGSTAPADAAPE